ncbi:MAG: hypothetical protein ACKO5K_08045 [Armatimonadota bacterium]
MQTLLGRRLMVVALLATLCLPLFGCGEKAVEPGKNDTPDQSTARKDKSGDD